MAVLTRFELAIEKAITLASFSFFDLAILIIEKGQISKNYKENEVANYMKDQSIDILVNLNMGSKSFTAYTMDLTKKYIEINADYRS